MCSVAVYLFDEMFSMKMLFALKVFGEVLLLCFHFFYLWLILVFILLIHDFSQFLLKRYYFDLSLLSFCICSSYQKPFCDEIVIES